MVEQTLWKQQTLWTTKSQLQTWKKNPWELSKQMLARNSYDTLSNVFFVFPLRFHPSEIKKILSSFSFPTNNQKPMGFTEKKKRRFHQWILSLGSTCAAAGTAWSSVAACHTWRWRRASKNAMPKGTNHGNVKMWNTTWGCIYLS